MTTANIAMPSTGRDVYRRPLEIRFSLLFNLVLLMSTRHNEARLTGLYTDGDVLLPRNIISAIKLATPAPAR
jgi:hypothetical protein